MHYHDKIDYSSLSTWFTCPRKFYFQYVLHLRSTRANIDLIFGSCWHYGLEVSYKELQETPTLSALDLARLSHRSFTKLWSIIGAPHFPDTDIIFPKSPGHAANMYAEYWSRYLVNDLENRIIGVETPFRLKLSAVESGLPDYIGRLDLVMLSPTETLKIIDHKTSKYVTKATYPGFVASLQTDGYLAAGYTYFDKIPQIEYVVALCQKAKIDFQRFVIMKRFGAIDRCLHEIAQYAKDIIRHLDQYAQWDNPERNYYFPLFPRQAGYACTEFFRPCAYFDICHGRNNPTSYADKPPQGYTIEEWNPEAHEENLKKQLKGATE